MDRFGDTAVSASTSTESVNFRQSVPKRNSVIWFRSHIAIIFGKISAFFHDSEPLPLPIFAYFQRNAELQLQFSTEVIPYYKPLRLAVFMFKFGSDSSERHF